jgi:carotenoid 1,2-hydratase
MDGFVPPAGRPDADAGTLSDGRQHASGARPAHGGIVRPAGSGFAAFGPRFDRVVEPGGYAWWYVDALSDDGQSGLAVIAFIGSVFSPYYARARRRQAGDPLDHCALNVALYRTSGSRWTMTERRRNALHRTADALAIGPSSVSWDGQELSIAIAETTVPFPSALRGRIRVFPTALANRTFSLDLFGQHRWQPIAPSARVEVELASPALRWSGTGYVDSNDGVQPLETAFSGWTWSRASLGGETAVLYDVQRRDGDPLSLALRFDRHGQAHDFQLPPTARLPATKWRIDRTTRADAGSAATVIRTLEDAPFYARSAIATRLFGKSTVAVHEALSLDRFRTRWVQTLLPFRMPRAWR